MKILSPAGNFESLKAAVTFGADEVYLGINEFNARNNIDGFSLETLKSAVDYAHVYGVKVCLAINILFTDQELDDAINIVVKAFNLGVDAFIMQDLGLISLISKNYPQVEIHASTQMGLHNLEGVKQVLKYGIKRVVLARETPLSEVRRIKENTDVEIEYFAQGALCVSFSGNCYLSSYLNNASGNRGKCKQLCRLPYTLYKGTKKLKSGYLLSAKDFNLSRRLDDLKNAGVDVIKIEGRARRPFYVASATREYYNALHGKTADQTALELAFNRTFTEGYFNGNGKIISDIQNHIGIPIGKVEKVNKGKTFNEVFITSNKELSPKSTFKFFDGKKEITTLTAFDLNKVGDKLYRITTTHDVRTNYEIRLIVDYKEEKEILEKVHKRNINVEFYAKVGCPVKAVAKANDIIVEVQGDVLQPAQKYPLSSEEVSVCFNKNEYFKCDVELKVFESVFIPKTRLNELRRELFAKLFDALIQVKRERLEYKKLNAKSSVKKFTDFQIIENGSEIFDKKNIILCPQTFDESTVLEFKNRCERENKKAYLDLPNFALNSDIQKIKSIVHSTGVGVIANNYYALGITENTVIGAGLNVYNTQTAKELNLPVISAESDLFSRIDFPFMTLRHCPLKNHLNASCDKCTFDNDYYYVLESGKKLKLKRRKLSDCTFYLTD